MARKAAMVVGSPTLKMLIGVQLATGLPGVPQVTLPVPASR
jgi:hypothetical protein